MPARSGAPPAPPRGRGRHAGPGLLGRPRRRTCAQLRRRVAAGVTGIVLFSGEMAIAVGRGTWWLAVLGFAATFACAFYTGQASYTLRRRVRGPGSGLS